MKIFYTTCDNGDGSSSVEFFDSQECIDYLEDEETGDEAYWSGEGGSWFEVPDGTVITFPSAYHKIKTLEEVKGGHS